MLISVRLFSGTEIKLDVQPTDTIQNVKKKIQDTEGTRSDLQRLMFNKEPLDNGRTLTSYNIGEGSIIYFVLKSAQNSKTIAGGYGQGTQENEMCFPYGIVVDEQNIIIADWGNHRIIEWKMGEQKGRVIAGGHGRGSGLNQLNGPTDVLIDKQTNSLIISDRGNNRVIQWSRNENTTQGQILLDNISCWGLAMDKDRFLYVSSNEKHEVRRYRIGEKNGEVVAGGKGRGNTCDRLNGPTYIFVDSNQNVYVSDTCNHRVMRWNQGNKEKGELVAKGFPRGISVDASGTVYIADYGKHQLVAWPQGATEGTIITGGADKEEEASELYYSWGLFYDQHEYIYVSDHSNHRIQRFPVKKAQ